MLKRQIVLVLLLGVTVLKAAPADGRLPRAGGTFVQFSRKDADRSVQDWKRLLDGMKAVGIGRVYVQWTADREGVCYFEAGAGSLYAERLPVLNRLFEALDGSGMEVFLGLEHDAHFWTRITAKGQTLRDYLLKRARRQQLLLKALNASFGNRKEWVGVYVTDEIDDVSWRSKAAGDCFRSYLRHLLDANRKTSKRAVAISAFCRGRTSPRVFRENLEDLLNGLPLNELLFQDGGGEADPPDEYLADYVKAVTARRDSALPQSRLILEVFAVASEPGKPFRAEPASPEAVRRRLAAVAGHFDDVVLFAFPQYMDPALGAGQRALFDFFKSIKQ